MNKFLHLCSKLGGSSKLISPVIKSKPEIFYKPIETCYRYYSQLRLSRAPLNINPESITKDVIVYKYENPRYFKFMNIFAIVQFSMFSMYSQFLAMSLRDIPASKKAIADDEDDDGEDRRPWYSKINLGGETFRYGMSIACFVVGECRQRAKWCRQHIANNQINFFQVLL